MTMSDFKNKKKTSALKKLMIDPSCWLCHRSLQWEVSAARSFSFLKNVYFLFFLSLFNPTSHKVISSFCWAWSGDIFLSLGCSYVLGRCCLGWICRHWRAVFGLHYFLHSSSANDFKISSFVLIPQIKLSLIP